MLRIDAEHHAVIASLWSKRQGRGINVLILWGAAMEAGFCSPHWIIFKQAKQLGAYVRKDELGAPVVYAGSMNRVKEQANSEQATFFT